MTKQTAVVGHPIAHSLSPLLHNRIFKDEGIDAAMTAIDNERIEPLVALMRTTPLHLTAVTLPHKQTIMPLLDEIDSVAREIGAVNTVVNRDGKLVGYNTDIVGIAAALKDVELEGKNALIIGSGGAAQPLAYHLKQKGANIFCHSREGAKAVELCTKYGGKPVISNSEFSEYTFDVVMNATPLGLKPGDLLPFPAELIRPDMVVFELNYTQSAFAKEAAVRGAQTITGLPMFLAQGLEQERLWLGREIIDRGYTALLEAELASRK